MCEEFPEFPALQTGFLLGVLLLGWSGGASAAAWSHAGGSGKVLGARLWGRDAPYRRRGLSGQGTLPGASGTPPRWTEHWPGTPTPPPSPQHVNMRKRRRHSPGGGLQWPLIVLFPRISPDTAASQCPVWTEACSDTPVDRIQRLPTTAGSCWQDSETPDHRRWSLSPTTWVEEAGRTLRCAPGSSWKCLQIKCFYLTVAFPSCWFHNHYRAPGLDFPGTLNENGGTGVHSAGGKNSMPSSLPLRRHRSSSCSSSSGWCRGSAVLTA